MSVRIKRFPIFILLPLRCVSEVIEGAMDILCLFKKVSRKACAALFAVESALMLIRDYGPLDIVDVNVTSPEARIKVKILLR